MRSTLLPLLISLCLAAPAAMAQVAPKAYAPEDLTILNEQDQARVIAKEYMDQSGNRQIPDDQLEFYLDQVESGWTFSQIKEDIARSLRGGSDGWQSGRPGYDGRPGYNRPGEGYGWGPPVTGAGRVVRCESVNERPRECATGFRGRATIVRQHSRTQCVEGRNWGQRPGMVWVNRGCRAEFAETTGNWDNSPYSSYSVTCASNYDRYTTCAWNDRYGRPVVIEQLSRDACVEGRSWGYRGSSIWVDNGCRARFGARTDDRDRYDGRYRD